MTQIPKYIVDQARKVQLGQGDNKHLSNCLFEIGLTNAAQHFNNTFHNDYVDITINCDYCIQIVRDECLNETITSTYT